MTLLNVTLLAWFGLSALMVAFLAVVGHGGHLEDVALGFAEA